MHRTFFSSSLCAVATLAVVLVAPLARATEVAPSAPADPSSEHLRGLEILLRPTLGSLGSSSPIVAKGESADIPQPFRQGSSLNGTSLGAGLQLGFRFHPLVSAGLRADLGKVGSETPDDATSNLSRSWQSAGLYARGYPLALHEGVRAYIDPWLASGITYVHDGQTFSTATPANNGGKVDVAWQADSHAIGIPIGIGVDYRITKWLSVGPSFEYVIMTPLAGCVKGSAPGATEARACTDDVKETLAASAAGAWNAGLSLRVTPF